MSTRERFLVSDALCGFIDRAPSRLEALQIARGHWRCPEAMRVTVFDRLARKGAEQIWNVGGRCISRRENGAR